MIEKKADASDFETLMCNHDLKISTLDNNIQLLANDFESFVAGMNKMSVTVQELADLN